MDSGFFKICFSEICVNLVLFCLILFVIFLFALFERLFKLFLTSFISGTASTAAPVGVGALLSATKSDIV